jgi:folylpolyglutamate synthase/dihydropteroate synthase
VPLPTLADTLAARCTETLIVPEVRAAVQRALDHASPDDLVLVTGSLFVVGEALEAFGPTEGRS